MVDLVKTHNERFHYGKCFGIFPTTSQFIFANIIAMYHQNIVVHLLKQSGGRF